MSQQPPEKGLTYAQAGVSIPKAEQVLKLIKPHCESTHDEYVLGGIGPFAAALHLGALLQDWKLEPFLEPVIPSISKAAIRPPFPYLYLILITNNHIQILFTVLIGSQPRQFKYRPLGPGHIGTLDYYSDLIFE